MNPETMTRDPLTGVYSRAYLRVQLREEVKRAGRYGKPLSLLLLDLDHFKSVNDAFGHTRGDQVLLEFVERLRVASRDSDLLFRYGGDEFVLLLPNTSKEQALILAQRLLKGVLSCPFQGDPPLSLSTSVGVAGFPEDAPSPEALFEKADLRLHEAKRRGRGQAVGEDPARPIPLPFEEISRLVERGEALATLHQFLEALPEKKRGVLVVTGPPGSGRTRFLAEAGKAARLWGYEVIALRGTLAGKARLYGALSEAWKDTEGLLSASVGAGEFARTLRRLLEERGRAGLLLTVDDLPQLDWATLELLRHLLLSSEISLLAMACSTDRESLRRLFPQQAPLQEAVELQALSQGGLRIWLRSLLQWEAPAEFLEWLYQQTNGLPGFLQKGLPYLLEQGILKKKQGNWNIDRDFAQVQLGEWLEVRAKTPPHNLPIALTSFVGREREIQEVKALLEKRRLLTLLGPGGIGKTRLAIQVAAEVIEAFPHGVYVLSLASLDSPDLLVPTIANSIKFSFYGQDPKVQLLNYLRQKRMLLVVDNFEHLVEEAALLTEIIQHAPAVTILVTSRERLNLQGESIFELEGMELPESETTAGVEGYGAVQLFLQSAQRVHPGFSFSEEAKPFVARVCQLVEGMPLGIELAAAWVRVLSCKEIAQEIETNLDFLTTPLRDVPARHHSLRAIFEHSWNLLSEEERSVLRGLSVCRGGFGREAAEKVAGASLPLLLALLDKSLLRRNPSGRYEMHEVIRQYAEEKLQEVPQEEGKVRDLHCAYYAEFLHQRQGPLKGERQKEALEEIGEEIENVRAGWRWAVEQGKRKEIGRSLESLFFFYEIRGWFQEGEAAFKRAVERLAGTSELVEKPKGEEDEILGKVLARQGWLCHRLSLYRKAQDLLQMSLSIFRRLGAREEMALSFNYLCAVAYDLGEYEQAKQLLQQSLAIRRKIGDRRGIAALLNNLGLVAEALGEYAEAKRLYQESFAIFKEIGTRFGMARSLTNLGNVACYLGEYAGAKQLYQKSLTICQENEDLLGIAFSLTKLGSVACMQKEYAEAKRLFQESLAIKREVGDQRGIAISLNHLGDVAHALGEYWEARRYFYKALKTALEIQAVPVVLDVLVGIAPALAKEGEKERAVELLALALHHPASEKEVKDQAERLLAKLGAELPPKVLATARKRGKARTFEEVVAEVLGEGD